MIVNEYGSEFPTDLEQMKALPGVGRSTAAAVLSSVYKTACDFDGNVKRTLARCFAGEGWRGQKCRKPALALCRNAHAQSGC